MLKKILAIVLIITVSLFISTSVFAEGTNMMDNAKNVVNDVVGNAQNVVNDATDGIKNVTGNAENTMNGVTDNVINDMNANNDNVNTMMDNGAIDNGDITSDLNGDYSATRTTATDTITTNSYVWIILAIAAIVVIGAIWYYAVRSTNDNHYDDK